MTKKRNLNQKSLAFHNLDFDSLVTLNESFSNIQFFERDHKYTINNEPAKYSVSGIIKKYEKPFDSEGIAKNVARRDGKTLNEVLNEWNLKKEYSCHKGSEFHLFVENFLERKKISINKNGLITFMVENGLGNDQKYIDTYYNEMAKMIGNFINFYDWWKKDHILLKSEFVVGDKETKLCGTLDNLSYNKESKKLVIFDYKTNKEIKKSNPRGETLLEPFTHLQNCELTKYSLQIWLYRKIIENNTPFEIDNGYIVWVSGTDDHELIPVLDLEDEANYILKNA